LLQRAYTDDGLGDGRITPEGIEMLSGLGVSAIHGKGAPALAAKIIGPGVAAIVGSRKENHDFYHTILDDMIAAHQGPRPLRVWSAACSSGEEPFSIAMTLAAALGEKPWEIVASDISTRVLERARTGHYAMARSKSIPREHLAAYCLRGTGSQEGTFLVQEKLRNRIEFLQVNLNETLPALGDFDAIFLRNVMIYFDMATKREVVSRIVRHLRPGGYLFIGHSESLNGVTDEVKSEVVALYRKAPR